MSTPSSDVGEFTDADRALLEKAHAFVAWLASFLKHHKVINSWSDEQREKLWPRIENQARKRGLDFKSDGTLTALK